MSEFKIHTVSLDEAEKRIGSYSETDLAKALDRLPYIDVAGPWIAGGAVRRTFTEEPLNTDFDFFFRDKEQLEHFQTMLIDMGASLVSANEKNHTYHLPEEKIDMYTGDYPEYKGPRFVIHPELKIQLIHFQYYQNPQAVLDSFDFTVSQFLFDGSAFHFSDFALYDVVRKKLVPHKISYGVSSLRRMLKYAQQGYTVCAGGLANVLEQVAGNPQTIQKETMYID